MLIDPATPEIIEVDTLPDGVNDEITLPSDPDDPTTPTLPPEYADFLRGLHHDLFGEEHDFEGPIWVDEATIDDSIVLMSTTQGELLYLLPTEQESTPIDPSLQPDDDPEQDESTPTVTALRVVRVVGHLLSDAPDSIGRDVEGWITEFEYLDPAGFGIEFSIFSPAPPLQYFGVNPDGSAAHPGFGDTAPGCTPYWRNGRYFPCFYVPTACQLDAIEDYEYEMGQARRDTTVCLQIAAASLAACLMSCTLVSGPAIVIPGVGLALNTICSTACILAYSAATFACHLLEQNAASDNFEDYERALDACEDG